MDRIGCDPTRRNAMSFLSCHWRSLTRQKSPEGTVPYDDVQKAVYLEFTGKLRDGAIAFATNYVRFLFMLTYSCACLCVSLWTGHLQHSNTLLIPTYLTHSSPPRSIISSRPAPPSHYAPPCPTPVPGHGIASPTYPPSRAWRGMCCVAPGMRLALIPVCPYAHVSHALMSYGMASHDPPLCTCTSAYHGPVLT